MCISYQYLSEKLLTTIRIILYTKAKLKTVEKHLFLSMQQEDMISYSQVYYLAPYYCRHKKYQNKFQLLYLESRIVCVKCLRYLKMAVESCNFKNSSSLYLKRARAKRNMICGGK